MPEKGMRKVGKVTPTYLWDSSNNCKKSRKSLKNGMPKSMQQFATFHKAPKIGKQTAQGEILSRNLPKGNGVFAESLFL